MNTVDLDWVGEAALNLDADVSRAVGMPAHCYTGEDHFEQEKQTTFLNRWVSIGFASDIPEAGDIVPVAFLGRNLFIVRNQEGAVNVFYNSCTHRGTQLVTGADQRKLIVCPYHAWSFDLDGELRAAPHHETCNKSEFGLRQVKSTVWNDVIFVNFSGTAPELQQVLAPLSERWSDFDFSHLRYGGTMTYEFAANWKLIVENFLECYHVPTVHPRLATYSKFCNRYPIVFDEEFIGQGTHVYRPEVVEAALPRWPDVTGDEEFQAEYVGLFPNTLVGRMPDHVFIWTLTPLSPHRTIERLNFYFIGDKAMGPQFSVDRQATLERWKEVNDEDFDIVQRLHAGSCSTEFPGARFAPEHEQTIHQFHKLAMAESVGRGF